MILIKQMKKMQNLFIIGSGSNIQFKNVIFVQQFNFIM